MSNQNRHDGERVEIIADMLHCSMSQADVARRLGISRARVGQIATAHGLHRTTGKTQRPLSQLQVRILSFLRAFAADHQYPPSIREVVEGCNLSSTAVASYNLSHLVEKGYLRKVPGIARGSLLTELGRSDALD